MNDADDDDNNGDNDDDDDDENDWNDIKWWQWWSMLLRQAKKKEKEKGKLHADQRLIFGLNFFLLLYQPYFDYIFMLIYTSSRLTSSFFS